MAKEHKAQIKKLEKTLLEQTSSSKKDVAEAPKAAAKEAPKVAPKPTPKSIAKPKTKSGLLDVKGIGPATAGKLNGVGIKTLDDLINSSKETLDKFSALRGSDTWVAQAKALKLA
jgi:predicted flap endonuclease-1-like 5' DNA nuclease